MGYKITVKTPTDLSSNLWQEEHQTQSVVAFADDTTWIASSKEALNQIIQVAEEFYKLNDIQINSNKSKLVIINPPKDQDPEIILNNTVIKAENSKAITCILGVWFNNKLKESYIVAKAKGIVQQTVQSLVSKKITLSQLVYINNIVIIPKLCYLLQVLKLSKHAIDSIHQPFIKLVKNKIGLVSTASNSLIYHPSMAIVHPYGIA